MRAVDLSDMPLNDLQKSIIDAIREFYGDDPAVSAFSERAVVTAGDAKEFLEQAKKLRHPGQPLVL